MLTLKRLRELHLSEPVQPGRGAHLSAASGLLQIGSSLYVVGDDELHLGIFEAEETKPGKLIRLFVGELPVGKAERKKQKPDLESIVRLPPFAEHAHGAILALGSGSRSNRRMGVLIALDKQGAASLPVVPVDFSGFLAPLSDAFPELNIEGAVVCGDELLLFQRRNTADSSNAIVRFPLSAVFEAISGNSNRVAPLGIEPVDLGDFDGVPLGFTDAACLSDGRIVFSAVAEDTIDTYNDGACVGACIGILDKSGKLLRREFLDKPYKVEGISVQEDNGGMDLLLVTDADDADIAATLYSLRL